jgi:DNA-binding GntR family transcriptional regulator
MKKTNDPMEQTRKEQAYQMIKETILTGELAPGDVLSEQRFATELEVSRTPVHEAIAQLAAEGFVHIMPSRGMVVAPISAEDIRHVYQARMVIEPGIARIVAQRPNLPELTRFKGLFASTSSISLTKEGKDLDREFHIALATETQNPYLVKWEDNLLCQCQRIRILSTHESQQRDTQAREEHLILIEALMNQKADRAAEISLAHLERTLRDYAAIFASCGIPGKQEEP